jgi:hypothetical protein
VKESFADGFEGSPSRMFDEAALAPVRQLNSHALDLLSECSRHPAWSGSAWENALGKRFSRMSAELRAGLAKSPISLLEFGCLDASASLDGRVGPSPLFLPLDKALELSHTMITLAWTLCRQDTAAAAVVFGLGSVEWIHNFDIRDLPRVSERISGGLRPRWLDRPRIWQELLRRPHGARPSRAAPAFLRIVQRQLVDVRPATGVSRPTRPNGL